MNKKRLIALKKAQIQADMRLDTILLEARQALSPPTQLVPRTPNKSTVIVNRLNTMGGFCVQSCGTKRNNF